ncbi:MAG: transporter substrate-binding domain-containing protein [Oscillospiraceae bacterium]|nr:transporter substrate-binding domain-containing protein [Oscillospiraceae bacterium]
MTALRRICSAFLIAVTLMAMAAGCSSNEVAEKDWAEISFSEIPGVSAGLKQRVESLRQQNRNFVLASVYGTEMFRDDDGSLQGFAVLVSGWLSGLFGIEFTPVMYDLDEITEGLAGGTVDFTTALTATQERREIYFMTEDIAQRHVITVRMEGQPPLEEIAQTRVLNYGFLQDSVTKPEIVRFEQHEFNAYSIPDFERAYEMLCSGEIDVFFSESQSEAVFSRFENVVMKTYFPFVFSPVSLAAKNAELSSIIEIVQLALESGAIGHLTQLYSQGQQAYLKAKLFSQLDFHERHFIRHTPYVYYAAETDNYPISFFNARTGEFEGIAIDLIREIEALTGISFVRINDGQASFSELIGLLEQGQASMLTELIETKERHGRFIWAGERFMDDKVALISKSEFRDININEIPYVSIGVSLGTAHEELLRNWFPNHRQVYLYDSVFAAFDALERGEVEMVMTSSHHLLAMTNFRELTGYKANFLFDYSFDSTFGFNNEEEVLASIVTRAVRLVDVDSISGRWLRRTYDFRVRLAEERFVYIIAGAVLLLVLLFTLILLLRKRGERFRFEKLIDIRTEELSLKQKELLRAVEAEQQANRTKTEFLSNMSHEIRTPMNAIIGMTDILELEELSNRQANYIKSINVSAHLLLAIINDLLDMSKIEAGKFELNPVDYNLHQLADNISSMFTYAANTKGLDFKVDFSEDLPPYLYGDDVRLRQVLINICGNAVKFTEKGYVKLSVRKLGDNLQFRIDDTGVGIRQADLPRLFDPFEQLDVSNHWKAVGTGLGLPISKSFVNMMGGEILVESEYGHGAAFIITIPIVLGNPDNIYSEKFQKNEFNLRAPGAKVLVVDDNDFNLKVAHGLLLIMDIDAELVDSGAKAIERILCSDYDIVFMDHMMPEMDGVETLVKIKQLGGKYKDIPIVALTANAVENAREMFLKQGFTDFVSKPIDVGALCAVLKRHLPQELCKSVANADAVSVPAGEDAELFRSSVEAFVKDNSDSYEQIISAVDAGDYKTAQRLAHSLKSIAAYLGKTELKDAAFALETAFGNGEASHTSEQLDRLSKELREALEEYVPIFKRLQEEERDGGKGARGAAIDGEELMAAIADLKDLLAAGDYSSVEYAGKLKGVAGLQEVIARVEDYDFSGALKLLEQQE